MDGKTLKLGTSYKNGGILVDIVSLLPCLPHFKEMTSVFPFPRGYHFTFIIMDGHSYFRFLKYTWSDN